MSEAGVFVDENIGIFVVYFLGWTYLGIIEVVIAVPS